MIYPYKFKPRLLEKMWGGQKFQTVLGKPLPSEKLIGESWELYDFPPGALGDNANWESSVVGNGPDAGKTLHELLLAYGADIHGDVPLLNGNQFPILIKFLDAKENLSVQVHPDAAYCANHPGAHLKTEAWYVLQADDGAFLYKDLKPGVTREAFEKSILDGTCEQLIGKIKGKVGDCHFLQSGTIHALGAGLLVAEVQTPSDTTFRVFDFNRIEPATGKPRKLHVKEALECIHFGALPTPTPAAGACGRGLHHRHPTGVVRIFQNGESPILGRCPAAHPLWPAGCLDGP